MTDRDVKDYKITMINRKIIIVEGVENVESFDDEEIILETNVGLLKIKGDNLHIVQLNLEAGILSVEGYCGSLDFSEEKNTKGIKIGRASCRERV